MPMEYADSSAAAELLRVFTCFLLSRKWNNGKKEKKKIRLSFPYRNDLQWRDKRSCQLRHGRERLEIFLCRPRLTEAERWAVRKLGWEPAVGLTVFLTEEAVRNPLHKNLIPETTWVTTHEHTEMMTQNKFPVCPSSPSAPPPASLTAQVPPCSCVSFHLCRAYGWNAGTADPRASGINTLSPPRPRQQSLRQ